MPAADPRQNRLIAALPAEDYARIAPALDLVPIPLGHALFEPGTRMRHVYFPIDSIVSLLCVMEAAGKLQRAGLIEYHRGHINVLDRSGLEARVCECYAVVKREYERLLRWSDERQ